MKACFLYTATHFKQNLITALFSVLVEDGVTQLLTMLSCSRALALKLQQEIMALLKSSVMTSSDSLPFSSSSWSSQHVASSLLVQHSPVSSPRAIRFSRNSPSLTECCHTHTKVQTHATFTQGIQHNED